MADLSHCLVDDITIHEATSRIRNKLGQLCLKTIIIFLI